MGSSATADLKAVIARRKDALGKYACRAPAERMILRGTLCRNFIVQSRQAGHSPANLNEAGDLLLQGIPSSPGTVTAEAVFVDDPAAAPPVAGKIIVARMTDPGWVFLMAAAAGLIVERGSLLSHTAIIGRELGVPTIVGAAGACELLSNGAAVTMDGSTGRIMQTCRKAA
jgi:pyruvate,water dikinase